MAEGKTERHDIKTYRLQPGQLIIFTSGEYEDYQIEEAARVLKPCVVEDWNSFYDTVKIAGKPAVIIKELVDRGFIQLLSDGETVEICVGEYGGRSVEFREIGEEAKERTM